MQISRSTAENPRQYIRLHRYTNTGECSNRGAFACSETLRIELEAARRLGVCLAELVLSDDRTGQTRVIPLAYDDSYAGVDAYTAVLPLCELCGGKSNGLFYFFVRLYVGRDELYLSAVNNIDFDVISDRNGVRPFRLLVYADGFTTPEWAKSAVMYHIFVDRFAKSARPLPVRENSRINPDWDNGTPEFAPYPGAPLANNEFFGGSLYGVTEKLDYLQTLGVNCLYLSPIFKAYSNHKYDTGDYFCVDEMFGGESALDELLQEAKKRGMHVILDGVFNHTGDDSRYFNRYGHYDSVGAYQSLSSPYHDWYSFRHFPDDYECWWGIPILPKLNGNHPDVREFFLGKNGVVRHYLARGTSGWRLDVADELPSDFLTELRASVKAQDPDALIIGEVWENAADKIAYGARREYLSGFQLDSVMNYPVKNAVIDYVKTRDCTFFYNTVTEIYSGYPVEVCAVVMNLLGTHDTERILTVLGTAGGEPLSNAEKAERRLTPDERERALRLLKIAAVLQFTLPGMPSVFYGDEAGMEGYGDPFCRRPYPWGREDRALTAHYRALARLKRSHAALHGETLDFVRHDGPLCAYTRTGGGETLLVMVNMSESETVFQANGAGKLLIADQAGSALKEDAAQGVFHLAPESVTVAQLR